MRKSFKFRLYPNHEQKQKMFFTLNRCRELYNAALSERKDSYKYTGKGVTYYDQKKDLPEIKDIREEYKDIHSQVLQDVFLRLDKGMKSFFRRVKNGEKAGFPRFQGRNRYDSFTYPQGGYTLSEKHVTLSKIGKVKVKLYRAIEGDIKTATVKREVDQWSIIFSCEVEQPVPLPEVQSEIGIDLGVTHFAALSDGTFIDSPRFFRKAQKDLKRKQRHLSRCKRGSHRRDKARKQVAKCYRKVKNQRRDFHFKEAKKLAEQHQVIVFEDLQLTNLTKHAKPKQDEATGEYLPNGASAKSGLTKSILDAGLGQFVKIVTFKAANAGRQVYTIDPKYTSQVCSACGVKGPRKDLSVRGHTCTSCGLVLDRDTNAAINIHLAWKTPTYWNAVRGAARQCVEAPAFLAWGTSLKWFKRTL